MTEPQAVVQSTMSYDPSVQPLITKTLGEAASLAQQQYKPYEYQRIAGFDPLQMQAQQATANLAVSPYVNPAAQIAGGVAMQGLGTFYDPTYFRTNQFTDPGIMGSYMSP